MSTERDTPGGDILIRVERPTRRVSDGLVLGCASGTTLHLPPTAAAVWHLLAEPASITSLERDLAEVYPDIAPDDIREAVGAIVDRLVEAGLAHG